VHDYVKSYVGEGKAQKKFAVDYLERRSRWKNSLKSGAKYEDDLTTPANALTPGDGEFQVKIKSEFLDEIINLLSVSGSWKERQEDQASQDKQVQAGHQPPAGLLRDRAGREQGGAGHAPVGQAVLMLNFGC
jgi:hypothetical protein